MIKKILGYAKKGAIALGALVLGLITKALPAKAAADSDLTAAIASSTAYITDNKGAVLGWITTLFGVVIIIVILIGLLSRARRQIGGAVGGGKRRR